MVDGGLLSSVPYTRHQIRKTREPASHSHRAPLSLPHRAPQPWPWSQLALHSDSGSASHKLHNLKLLPRPRRPGLVSVPQDHSCLAGSL